MAKRNPVNPGAHKGAYDRGLIRLHKGGLQSDLGRDPQLAYNWPTKGPIRNSGCKWGVQGSLVKES